MELLDGRAVISADDSPHLLCRVLQASIRLSELYMTSDERFRWTKTANDAWEALRVGFSLIDEDVWQPLAEIPLFMTPDQLELAIVAYGCAVLEGSVLSNVSEELTAINGLLLAIDETKSPQP